MTTHPKTQKSALRKFLYKIHKWLGLSLGIPIALMGLTGSFLVVISMIEDQKVNTALHSKLPVNYSVNEIIDVAQERYPGLMPTMVRVPLCKGDEAIVRTKRDSKKGATLAVDPISLEVRKDEHNAVTKFILEFHHNLLMKNGKNIVGVLGIVLLLFCLTGIIIWWPKKGRWQESTLLNAKLNGVAFHKNLHKAFGFWSFIALFVISFSGIYLVFTDATGSVIRSIFSARDLKQTPKVKGEDPIKDVEKIVGIAVKSVPNSRLFSIMLPAKSGQPYRVNLIPQDYDVGRPQITVFVNQFTGKAIQVQNPEEYSVGENIIAWQGPIHKSHIGLWWNILQFFLGLLPTLFAITGFYIWYKKKKNKKTSVSKKCKAKS